MKRTSSLAILLLIAASSTHAVIERKPGTTIPPLGTCRHALNVKAAPTVERLEDLVGQRVRFEEFRPARTERVVGRLAKEIGMKAVNVWSRDRDAEIDGELTVTRTDLPFGETIKIFESQLERTSLAPADGRNTGRHRGAGVFDRNVKFPERRSSIEGVIDGVVRRDDGRDYVSIRNEQGLVRHVFISDIRGFDSPIDLLEQGESFSVVTKTGEEIIGVFRDRLTSRNDDYFNFYVIERGQQIARSIEVKDLDETTLHVYTRRSSMHDSNLLAGILDSVRHISHPAELERALISGVAATNRFAHQQVSPVRMARETLNLRDVAVDTQGGTRAAVRLWDGRIGLRLSRDGRFFEGEFVDHPSIVDGKDYGTVYVTLPPKVLARRKTGNIGNEPGFTELEAILNIASHKPFGVRQFGIGISPQDASEYLVLEGADVLRMAQLADALRDRFAKSSITFGDEIRFAHRVGPMGSPVYFEVTRVYPGTPATNSRPVFRSFRKFVAQMIVHFREQCRGSIDQVKCVKDGLESMGIDTGKWLYRHYTDSGMYARIVNISEDQEQWFPAFQSEVLQQRNSIAERLTVRSLDTISGPVVPWHEDPNQISSDDQD